MEDILISEEPPTKKLKVDKVDAEVEASSVNDATCDLDPPDHQDTLKDISDGLDDILNGTNERNDEIEEVDNASAGDTDDEAEKEEMEEPPPLKTNIPEPDDPDIQIVGSSKKSRKTLKSATTGGKKKKKQAAAHMRKNIKDILKSDQLDKHTIEARKEEAERRERMQMKQKILLEQQQSNYLRHQLQIKELYEQQMKLMNETSSEKDQYLKKFYESHKKLMSEKFKELPPPVHEVVTVSSDDDDDEITFINEPDRSNSTHTSKDYNYNSSVDVPVQDSDYSNFSNIDTKKLVAVEENDDDDCIVISPTPEDDIKDENNLDALNVPDELGRVLVNVGHPENDPDIFLPPQISKLIKPHQVSV